MDDRSFDSPLKQRHFCHNFQTDYGAYPASYTVVMGWIPHPPRARGVGDEADRLRSLESNWKKEWYYTCTSPRVFPLWCLVMEGDKHILPLRCFTELMYCFSVRFFHSIEIFRDRKPLFKRRDRIIVSNFRPIYFLTSFSEVFEKDTNWRLHKRVDENNMLVHEEYDFRSNSSPLKVS